MKSDSRKRRRVRLYIYYNPVHFESEIVDEYDCRGSWQEDDSDVLEPGLNVNGYEMSSYDLSEAKEKYIKRSLIRRVMKDSDKIIRRHKQCIDEYRKIRRDAAMVSKNLSKSL